MMGTTAIYKINTCICISRNKRSPSISTCCDLFYNPDIQGSCKLACHPVHWGLFPRFLVICYVDRPPSQSLWLLVHFVFCFHDDGLISHEPIVCLSGTIYEFDKRQQGLQHSQDADRCIIIHAHYCLRWSLIDGWNGCIVSSAQ